MAAEDEHEETSAILRRMDEQYIAHKDKAFPAQLDITAPEKGVTVEYDWRRKVLYVHVDGYTALRICRLPKAVEFDGNCVLKLPSTLTHGDNRDCPEVQSGQWAFCRGHTDA